MSTPSGPPPQPPVTLGRLLAGWVTRPSFWALFVILLLGIPGAAWFLSSARVPAPLETYGDVPAFELVRHDGNAFGKDSLAGKVWIANFIFTRCPTVCPKFTAQMAKLQGSTEIAGERLQLVSFSVDPKYDTPERLEAYGQKYGADFARWSFLTGEDEVLKRTIVDGLKISMGRDPEVADEVASIFHGEHFVLVDREGKIRGYYQSSDPEALTRLVRDSVALATAE